MVDRSDYLQVLQALEQLPFGMGKAALTAVLRGDKAHETVHRNRLDREACFGCLSGYSEEEAHELLRWLRVNGMVDHVRPPGTYFRVLALTPKGRAELQDPKLHCKEERSLNASPITREQRKLFEAFDFFLKQYTDEQKHAITAQGSRVLCVAGAGTGKTLVLTKRIEFLTRFCGVPRDRVLAITFTRKARQEMHRRLQGSVQVETFNSFCEHLLSRHGNLLYGKQVRVMGYRDKIRLLHHALRKLNLDPSNVVQTYFTSRQRRDKTRDQLVANFMNDCFSILDYYANLNRPLEDFSAGNLEAKMVHAICLAIQQEMREVGLRDYSDQLRDGLALLREHPEIMPRYEHVLVDEYQDVNAIQQELLALLRPANLFAVGDPRQGIFGWRGSRVEYLLDFPADETVILTRNYRSGRKIVHAANAIIKRMRLPDLEPHRPEGSALLHTFRVEEDEAAFLAAKVLASTVPREEIFVLTRTNRQLQDIAALFAAHGIAHVMRSDEDGLQEPGPGEVVLSTVHAIKGLEASVVFVPFCNAQSYPCKAGDHPVLELVKRESHDREAEELRLLYVALTRARTELHVSYSGTPSAFLSNDVRKLLGASYDRTLPSTDSRAVFQKLREWRSSASRKLGIPAYMVLPDKTLVLLAENKPQALAELQGIPGIGPAKSERYGEELLHVLRE